MQMGFNGICLGSFYESANEQLSAQKHKTVLVPIRKDLEPKNLFPKPNPSFALQQQLV